MTSLTKLVVLAACLVIPACKSGSSYAANNELPTTLLVDNLSVLDHTIYVIHQTQRIRVGTATALSKSHLTIPRGIVFGLTTLRFMADPIGSNRTPVSEEINVNQGEEITLRIPP